MKRSVIAMTLLVISMCVFVPTLSYSEELGEFCWRDTETMQTDTCILRLQVTQHGNYYTFNGKETCGSGEEGNVFGSGYINGGLVKIGLTYINRSEGNPNRIELNLSDLNGNWYDISESDVDPLFFMSCP